MKKIYEAPALITHGNVTNITALSGGTDRTDFLFGTNGQATGISGHGSLDACLTKPGQPTPDSKCIVK